MPEKVLPWFTTNAAMVIERVEPVVYPYFRRYIGDGELPDVDPRILMDAVGRMALSLVFTSGIVDLQGEAALREYVSTIVRAIGGRPVGGLARTPRTASSL
jgi:hypothetical protein